MLEAVTLNWNRIFLRLRSRHGSSKSNFAKRKKDRRPLLIQLYDIVRNFKPIDADLVDYVTLHTDVCHLHLLFMQFEGLATENAKSAPGLSILIKIVTACQQLRSQKWMHKILGLISDSDQTLKDHIAVIVTKLGRYVAISGFLSNITKRLPIFKDININVVKVDTPKCLDTELDVVIDNIINELIKTPKGQLLLFKAKLSSERELKSLVKSKRFTAKSCSCRNSASFFLRRPRNTHANTENNLLDQESMLSLQPILPITWTLHHPQFAWPSVRKMGASQGHRSIPGFQW